MQITSNCLIALLVSGSCRNLFDVSCLWKCEFLLLDLNKVSIYRSSCPETEPALTLTGLCQTSVSTELNSTETASQEQTYVLLSHIDPWHPFNSNSTFIQTTKGFSSGSRVQSSLCILLFHICSFTLC